MDWTTFFVVSAGASATLVGLLFIGVQINIERFGSDPKNSWNLLARSTYLFFALLFLGSFVFLIPTLADRARGQILIGLSAGGIVRVLLSWRGLREFSRQFGARLFVTLVLPFVAYGLIVLGSIRLWTRQGTVDEARELISVGFWFLYVVALRNSWSLLFDARQVARAMD